VVGLGSSFCFVSSLVGTAAWQVVHWTPIEACHRWLKRTVIRCGGKIAELGPSSGESLPGGSQPGGMATSFGIGLTPDRGGAAAGSGGADADVSDGSRQAATTATTIATKR
jgi:hypothetical protein